MNQHTVYRAHGADGTQTFADIAARAVLVVHGE